MFLALSEKKRLLTSQQVNVGRKEKETVKETTSKPTLVVLCLAGSAHVYGVGPATVTNANTPKTEPCAIFG